MWLSILILTIVLTKIYNKLTSVKCYSDAILTGKVVIVTGASSGIGYNTARDLAWRGAKVILACRDEKKGIRAMENIKKATKNNTVVYKHLDLASLDSIRRFVEDFKGSGMKLDILVNNACSLKGTSLTSDGIVRQMQINYFGPFLLTILLVPVLKKSGPSRIINVSALLHRYGTVDLDRINTRDGYSSPMVYCNSKLCNVIFTKELSRRLADTGVVVNSLHPGFVQTNNKGGLVEKLVNAINRLFLKSRSEGAQTSIYLAVSDECDTVTGKHFAECQETSVSDMAEDVELASRLWSYSEDLVKLKPEEKLCA